MLNAVNRAAPVMRDAMQQAAPVMLNAVQQAVPVALDAATRAAAVMLNAVKHPVYHEETLRGSSALQAQQLGVTLPP